MALSSKNGMYAIALLTIRDVQDNIDVYASFCMLSQREDLRLMISASVIFNIVFGLNCV
jgi:hypothetical protein